MFEVDHINLLRRKRWKIPKFKVSNDKIEQDFVNSSDFFMTILSEWTPVNSLNDRRDHIFYWCPSNIKVY